MLGITHKALCMQAKHSTNQILYPTPVFKDSYELNKSTLISFFFFFLDFKDTLRVTPAMIEFIYSSHELGHRYLGNSHSVFNQSKKRNKEEHMIPTRELAIQ